MRASLGKESRPRFASFCLTWNARRCPRWVSCLVWSSACEKYFLLRRGGHLQYVCKVRVMGKKNVVKKSRNNGAAKKNSAKSGEISIYVFSAGQR
jgi:hypothetical protein